MVRLDFFIGIAGVKYKNFGQLNDIVQILQLQHLITGFCFSDFRGCYRKPELIVGF